MRHIYKFINRVFPLLISIFIAHSAFAQSLYEMPQAVESRVASGENPTGEKGKGGQAKINFQIKTVSVNFDAYGFNL